MRLLAVIIAVSGLLFASQAALAEKRIALVVGNGAYQYSPLPNPPNDADLMAKTLADVGFEVTKYKNLGRRDLKRAFFDFGQKLERAGDGAVALIYYAGHGVQLDGENYLIPVDTQIEDAFDVEIEAIRASSLLKTFSGSESSLNIVILDACRNNPFKGSSRSAGRGLAKMDAPTGTLLAYSTSPGNVAVDGNGANSPYTKALANAIREPGATVEQVFKHVRISVMDRTQGKQVPWESSSLIGNFSFVGSAPQIGKTQPLPVEEPVQSANVRSDSMSQVVEIEFWKSISDSNNPDLFQSYLDKFPNGIFVDIAKQRVQTASTDAATSVEESELVFFQSIQNSDRIEDFQAYLDRFPNGKFAPIANARIKTIREKQASQKELAQRAAEKATWDTVKDSNNAGLLQAFLDVYPNGTYAATAKSKIAALTQQTQVASTASGADEERTFWNSVKDAGTAAEIMVYLESYPNGRFADEARTKLASLSAGTTATASRQSFDGAWRLTARHVEGPYGRIPFCRSGETLETVVLVENGYFDTKANSNKNAPVTIQGQINTRGILDLEFVPWGSSDSGGWGNTIERGDLVLHGSLAKQQMLKQTVGQDCKVELLFSRSN
ncbi:MAG: caspase family protein [Alphaproteobacteria bacterium]